MKPLRLGISATVHTLPLVHGLDAQAGLETVTGRPGALADMLRHGKLDAALIPAVEFFRGVGDGILPGLCIASEGADSAFRLIADRPLNELCSVFVDKGSRTGVAALRLLLDRTHGITPDFRSYDPDPADPLAGPGDPADAALLIGDAALKLAAGPGRIELDLGEWWERSFHRPLVHTLWAYRNRPDEDTAVRLEQLLRESYRRGREAMAEIAVDAAARLEINESAVTGALEKTSYELDGVALAGLRLFHRLCVEDHLAPFRLEVEQALAALPTEPHRQAAPAR